MKKLILTMVALLGFAVSSQAMSYEQARQQALFLADKMAYELNLTEDQYEACYEVNLDYLMSIKDQRDLYGDYWTRRNLDLSYILLSWQYDAFVSANYFYRPLYWSDGYWHFGIYAYYPHRNYFYFGRPHFWEVYRGGHSWHSNGGHSWYHGRSYAHVGGKPQPHDKFHGMRDGFNRGDYGRGHDYDKPHTPHGQKNPSSTRSSGRRGAIEKGGYDSQSGGMQGSNHGGNDRQKHDGFSHDGNDRHGNINKNSKNTSSSGSRNQTMQKAKTSNVQQKAASTAKTSSNASSASKQKASGAKQVPKAGNNVRAKSNSNGNSNGGSHGGRR